MEKISTILGNVSEFARARFGKTFIVVVLFFLFFVTGGGISHNAKWHIEHVNVGGVKTVSEDVVRSLVRQKLEGNYFFVYARENSRLFPKSEIEQMLLETFPRLESVKMKRIDDHVVEVFATERTPYALWCGTDVVKYDVKESCWFIDGAGFVFDRAPIFSKGVYTEVYSELIEKNKGEPLRSSVPYSRFATANAFAKLVDENIGKPFRVEVKPEGELEVSVISSVSHPFFSGVTIKFKDESSPAILMKNLLAAIPVQFPDNTALKKKLLYVDMRFGNKVIFGFEN